MLQKLNELLRVVRVTEATLFTLRPFNMFNKTNAILFAPFQLQLTATFNQILERELKVRKMRLH